MLYAPGTTEDEGGDDRGHDQPLFCRLALDGPRPGRERHLDAPGHLRRPGRDRLRRHRGNFLSLHTTPWIDFLATFGSVVLTFLAGAEIDPDALRRHLKASLALGAVSFALPCLGAFLFALFVAHWPLRAAEIAGIALSTTSVAVVYAVMVETGLNRTDIGKPVPVPEG